MVSDMMRGALLPRIYIALLPRSSARMDSLGEVGPAVADLIERAAPHRLATFGDRFSADALIEVAERIIAQHPQETAAVVPLDQRREGGRQQLPTDAALLEIRQDIERVDLADLFILAGEAPGRRAIAEPRRPE